ncbi:tripeptidyl peptidase I [Thecamonas trahens ATCC 50062]|uniref:Tripeptidyl peptidase I n=1 Tax=Thecamonas trahens ATCC 50062 TaxID=461836 RepID=A0A0L0DIK6_THETB|nr:tripeptidyl peptidase I [Thecamonas trahens ATCC 50062]KNC51158.1 tripeptidyl peptidase I [Thecamonas trahens ATCC 50062]|eukprot:XP_013756360.1 tripeptidyl peptidase I [Thecamonas trahens ATCC 50062]
MARAVPEAVSVAQVETAGFVARARTGEEGDRMVEIRLLLAAPRLDELKEVLAKVSDPYSPSYGQYLTKEEVASYTRVEQAVIDSWQAAVTAAAPGASAVVSDYGDAVTATMTVAEAEALTGAAFAVLTHKEAGVIMMRPLEAATWPGVAAAARKALVFAIGVEDVALGGSDLKVLELGALRAAEPITPKVIKANYGVGNATGHANNTQAVAEFSGQYFEPSDLATFLANNDLPPQTVAKIVGGDDGPVGVEASLDVQTIIGTGTATPTWFVYGTQGSTFAELIHGWASELAAMAAPPLVNSVSYGLGNTNTPDGLKTQIDAEFVKLGSRGVSIIFSSGDHGTSCELFREDVQYPASSPYVLSVGATYLDSSGTEVGATLSGGGFGRTEPMPQWQEAAVKAYLAAVPSKPPAHEFDATKRAIPDISAYGENVIIVVNGENQGVAGTSCSAPMAAAIFALVNGDRLAAGTPPLGFLPPIVYAHGDAFHDITSGRNSDGLCHGWEAIKGFDLVTGWGSPNYAKFRAAAMSVV